MNDETNEPTSSLEPDIARAVLFAGLDGDLCAASESFSTRSRGSRNSGPDLGSGDVGSKGDEGVDEEDEGVDVEDEEEGEEAEDPASMEELDDLDDFEEDDEDDEEDEDDDDLAGEGE